MKRFFATSLLTAMTVQYAQDKGSSILGDWAFQSMTTITSEEESDEFYGYSTILIQDNK